MSQRRPEAGDRPLSDLPLRDTADPAEHLDPPDDLPLRGSATRRGGLFDEPALGNQELLGDADEPRAYEKTLREKLSFEEAEYGAAGYEEEEYEEGEDEEAVYDDEDFSGEDGGRGARPLGRLLAGLLDIAAQLLALLLTALLSLLIGIPIEPSDWPPFAVLGLFFSFLYFFVPLAFWGHTPGMAWFGYQSRSASGEGLTFGQTVFRWLGALLTVVLLGLPWLLTLTGRSLSDRLSDSQTLRT